MEHNPPLIPLRLACRIWAACAADQAAHLKGMTSPAAMDLARSRGGRAGVAGAVDKQAGRLAQAHKLERAATTLGDWARGYHSPYDGMEVHAEVVGLVCASLYRDGNATAELKARCEGETAYKHPGYDDLAAWIRYVVGALR